MNEGLDDFDMSDLLDEPEYTGPPILYNHLPFFKDLLACQRCTIRSEAQRVVPGIGPLDAAFMILGRNPGKDEDAAGQPFIGKGGQELDNWLEILGLDRSKIIITNLAKCHTTKDRPPRPIEYATCGEAWFSKELQFLPRLRVIIGLGNDVVQYVLGKEAASTGHLNFYNVFIRTQGRNYDFIPLAHPGYLVRARTLIHRMHTGVLPRVKEHLQAKHAHSYARSARG